MVRAAENASFGEREDGVLGRFNYTWEKALWESREKFRSTHGPDLLAPARIART